LARHFSHAPSKIPFSVFGANENCFLSSIDLGYHLYKWNPHAAERGHVTVMDTVTRFESFLL
jgi:hypothetical protein